MPRDAFDHPQAQEWAQDVLTGMAPKLRDSAAAISIFPSDGVGDVKFWVELGASIMMDKPIIVYMTRPAELPKKLAAVADEVVVGPVDPNTSEKLMQAIERVVSRL